MHNDTRRSWRPDVATTPTRSTTCWPFLGSSADCSTAALRHINDEMLSAAANAIANQVAPDQLNPSYIIPSVFDASVSPAVAAAVRQIGEQS